MSVNEERKRKEDVEEVREILGVVSKEIPALVKGIIESVFSEDAGRNMGKAAAAFYKELKESGMPDEVAVKMTENYISVFASLGDVMKKISAKREVSFDLDKEIEKKIKKKLAEKGLLEEETEEEEE